MASGIFLSALEYEARGGIDYDTDTFYVMLATSGYSPDYDAHDFRNDITNEVSGAGYTAGGQACTVTVGAKDVVNNRVDIAVGGAVWGAATITARYAIVYKRRGGASSADELVMCVDFGSDVTSTGADFTLTGSTIRKAQA